MFAKNRNIIIVNNYDYFPITNGAKLFSLIQLNLLQGRVGWLLYMLFTNLLGGIIMDKKKNIFLLSLLLGIALFVSACSDDASGTKDDTGNTNDTSTEETSDNSNIIVSGDMVSELDGCVLQSRYTVGDNIVWRMDAIDPGTQEQMEDATLQVHLSTGEVLDMRYGSHPADTEGAPKFWTVAYEVTEDTPTGTMEYFVTAESGDKKGEFRPFNVKPSLLTIVEPETADQSTNTEEEVESEEITTNQNVDIVATNFAFNEDKFYVKAGEEATVNLTSEEGTHGIAIKGLDVAIDEPNGTAKFTPTEAGEYQIVCSVYCGAGHGDMTATLVVVE